MRLFKRTPKHAHSWRPDSFFERRYLGEPQRRTFVMAQCSDPDCAKVEEQLLAKVQLTDAQLINLFYAKYGVMVEKTSDNKWVKV